VTTANQSFVCPACRRESFNPHDIAQRYCAACHRFFDERSNALFNAMSTPDLEMYRAALRLDLETATQTVLFCNQRLGTIERVLRSRQ